MTGWCEETTATRCVPYIFPGWIQYLLCQRLLHHSRPGRHQGKHDPEPLFQSWDAAEEASNILACMALRGGVSAPPTTNPGLVLICQDSCLNYSIYSVSILGTGSHLSLLPTFVLPCQARCPTVDTQSMSRGNTVIWNTSHII